MTKVPSRDDPGFEEGHLKIGHVYGFYTKEGSYVLLKIQNEEEIPPRGLARWGIDFLLETDGKEYPETCVGTYV